MHAIKVKKNVNKNVLNVDVWRKKYKIINNIRNIILFIGCIFKGNSSLSLDHHYTYTVVYK